jgi:hypothetical protein
MKKIISILLLGVFAFNLGGYYLAFKALQVSAHQDMIERINNEEYNEDLTVELKIHLALPYATSPTSEFKRVNGRFEYQGDVYKLVKQKHENDTLYIICIKDHMEKRLITEFKDYAQKAQDTPGSTSKKESGNSTKQIIKDYFSNSTQIPNGHWGATSIDYIFSQSAKQTALMRDVPTPPPQS